MTVGSLREAILGDDPVQSFDGTRVVCRYPKGQNLELEGFWGAFVAVKEQMLIKDVGLKDYAQAGICFFLEEAEYYLETGKLYSISDSISRCTSPRQLDMLMKYAGNPKGTTKGQKKKWQVHASKRRQALAEYLAL